jgi:secretion/DNA translocation related TadE-like protein
VICRPNRCRRWPGRRRAQLLDRERGSASVFVLAGAALVLVIGLVVAVRTSAILARHRAESAADLAALAAAGQIGVGPAPCAVAATIAVANAATLVSCTPLLDADGRSGTVVVQVRVAAHLPMVGDRSVQAQARAGRLPG